MLRGMSGIDLHNRARDMNATSTDAKAAPSGSKKRKFLIVAAALLCAGGGAGAAVWVGLPQSEPEGPERPELVVREGVSDAAVAEAQAGARRGRPDPAVYLASYHTIEEPFTSNLAGGSHYLQIGIAVSTYYDQRVLDAVERHEPAIRSAVLALIAEQDPVALTTQAGKERLQRDLAATINRTLNAREGFGGIDAVHFSAFVMQ